MKNKIIFLVIGIVIGAVLASAGFLVYNNVHKNDIYDRQKQTYNRGTRSTDGKIPEGADGNSTNFNKNNKSSNSTNT